MKPFSQASAAFVVFVTTAHARAEESGNTGSFYEPFEHLHFSPTGAPIIHSFGVEPAFTGRDLFFDYSWREGNGVTEHETAVELEWAFTKRLGIIMEVPYLYEDEEGVASASGFGDLALVPRALLIDTDRFMLTGQIEAVLPTGSNSFGNETSIAPGISTWNDLGNWFTLNSQIAVEHGFDSDETEFAFGFGLVKSFGEKPDIHTDHSGHYHHSSGGLVNLHFEVTGSTPLNGPSKGDFEIEGLIGISYGLIPQMDIRLGYQFPLSTPKAFDHGVATGLIFHF